MPEGRLPSHPVANERIPPYTPMFSDGPLDKVQIQALIRAVSSKFHVEAQFLQRKLLKVITRIIIQCINSNSSVIEKEDTLL